MGGCIGLVLVGGKSSRMGRDKATLHYGELALHAHMAELLRQAGCAELRYAGNRPELGAIPDAPGWAGPLAGIAAAALAGTPGQDLLVVPVDMPMLDAALLRGLVQAPAGTAWVYEGYPLPARLPLGEALLAALAALKGGAKPSVRALLDRLAARRLPLPAGAEARMANANTPEDWAAMTYATKDDRREGL